MLFANVCAILSAPWSLVHTGGTGSAGLLPHVHRARDLRGVHWFAQNFIFFTGLEGRPSLHGYDACMVYWIKEHSREIAGKNEFYPAL